MAKPNLQRLQAEAIDYHRRGDFEQAEKRYREILRHMPNMAEIHNSRGAALASLKRIKDAVEAFRRAVALENSNGKFHFNLGNALKELGRTTEAIGEFESVIRIQPNHVDARIQLGIIYKEQERFANATEQFYRACELKPDYVEAFEQLGYALMAEHRYENAIETFQRAITLSPTSLMANTGMGEALLAINKVAEAVVLMEHAVALYPDSANAKLKLGRAMQEMGQYQKAEELYLAVIQQMPGKFFAYLELAAAKKFSAEDKQLIENIDQMISRGNLSQIDTIAANFALGKMLDDCGNYEKAFHHYKLGNTARGLKYSSFKSETLHEQVTASISVYTKEFFMSHSGIGNNSAQPVFVIGMPRSGTTLTEQILASHLQIAGAGEVEFWTSAKEALPIELATTIPYPDCVSLLIKDVAIEISGKYLEKLHQLTKTSQALRIVDKMPQNFNFLGLIATIFPKTKIIHIQRDAMDTCLSIYFQNFRDEHPYAYDFVKLGTYYKEYERIMQHWREVLPIKMLEINYEELVADQERVTREMIDYIGLPWDERCLQPEKTNKVVRTASLWQARQPVYKTSVARWKHYEKHLQPLKEALGYTEK